MNSQIFLLLGLCLFIGVANAVPKRIRGPAVAEMRKEDYATDDVPRFVRSAQIPQGNNILTDAMVGHIFRNPVPGAQLLRSNPPGIIPAGIVPPQPNLPIMKRLPDNSTLIRSNIVDTFRCTGRDYGYYADQDNDCQLFHVCLNFQQIWPANFTAPLVYQFSFICPKYTIFSQDSMTCAWSQEAIPCSEAHHLYALNDRFFKIEKYENNAPSRREYPQNNQIYGNNPSATAFQG